jgi:hypothetical protein
MRGAPAIAALAIAAGAPLQAAGGKAAIRFVDETVERGVQDLGVNATGPTFGDYDDDGDVDIFVPVEDLAPGLHDRLFENDGQGRFRDVAAARGVQNPGSLSRGAVFCDFDGDGDRDLLSANMPPGQPRQRHVPTTLYRNQLRETGRADFTDVTRASGLMRAGNAKDAEIGGIGDIENALFRNDGGWRFTEVTVAAGAAVQSRLRESNAQGSPNWIDFDQDGHPDLLITNERDAKILLRNKGDGSYEDITRGRGARHPRLRRGGLRQRRACRPLPQQRRAFQHAHQRRHRRLPAVRAVLHRLGPGPEHAASRAR